MHRRKYYVAPIEAGIYRIRSGSLTHSSGPTYVLEGRRSNSLRRRAISRGSKGRDYRLTKVDKRYDCEGHCYLVAAHYALKLVRMTP